MKRFTDPLPKGPTASRFTLIELVWLITCAAIACMLVARQLYLLSTSFMITIIAFRTSIVDFSLLGGIAVLATMLFGATSIGLLILWSVGL